MQRASPPLAMQRGAKLGAWHASAADAAPSCSSTLAGQLPFTQLAGQLAAREAVRYARQLAG